MNERIVKIIPKIWILVSMMMVGGIGYLLGLEQSHGRTKSEIVIQYPTEAAITEVVTGQDSSLNEAILAPKSSTGSFVASKSGTKYYPQGCAGINRIKPENRVYFTTEEQAISLGLTRSKTCK